MSLVKTKQFLTMRSFLLLIIVTGLLPIATFTKPYTKQKHTLVKSTSTIHSQDSLSSKQFNFSFEGVTLNGVLNFPKNNTTKGIVLIVHGSGKTNAIAQQWYADVRHTIVAAGYSTYMWDKMGCGKSGGTFNYNQSIQNSTSEVIAAIHTLQQKQIPGSDRIGLWGISRAGWINPMVINRYKNIRFWISVSGVDDQENFKYLLEQNLRIEGLSKSSIDMIVSEWLEGTKICHSGGSFKAYQKATSNLSKNAFWLRFTNGGIKEKGYYNYQRSFMKEPLHKDTGLQIYVKDFDTILGNINCPVLALFGENDKHVNWKNTKRLYERTIRNTTKLTITSFPNCNHNLFESQTGGFYELQDRNASWTRCKDFLETMKTWLIQQK